MAGFGLLRGLRVVTLRPHTPVALTEEVDGWRAGTVGTVVDCQGRLCTVEVVSEEDGRTLALLDVDVMGLLCLGGLR